MRDLRLRRRVGESLRPLGEGELATFGEGRRERARRCGGGGGQGGGGGRRKEERRGGGKQASATSHFREVANLRKADAGFLSPVDTPRRGAKDPCAAFFAAPGPHPEEPAAREPEQVILFTASLIGEVPGLVFRLQFKIITRVMNLML